MIHIKLIAELLGAFTLIGVILSVGQALPIAIALAAAIYLFGKPSGGHFNPAVSFAMLLKGKITLIEFVMYVVAQMAGGYLALMWASAI